MLYSSVDRVQARYGLSTAEVLAVDTYRQTETLKFGTVLGCRQQKKWLSIDAHRVQFLGSVKAYLSTGYLGLCDPSDSSEQEEPLELP
ncbi:hypothetical protein Taro_026149 [Colocasia esculenta]|uniref:Uncharacterized protein n=1 Tax=Colocasia esculenta TaxID=4460 RepID=A0A843V5G8_COLES|nr:hypothetical protein [Colocasia esculenta]